MIRRLTRTAVLALVLGLAVLLVPDSAMQPIDSQLVKMQTAQGTDLGGLAHGKNVIVILAVGSDARPGENMLHTRGDALHLIFMNTRTHAAADIGIPRDSYVSIPGAGRSRINAALGLSSQGFSDRCEVPLGGGLRAAGTAGRLAG